MLRLIPRLRGPFLDFIVVASGEYLERIHPKRRTLEIKREYFRHPDALRVPLCVFMVANACFERTHPQFCYYRATEFAGELLECLIAELRALVEAIQACKWKREFGALIPKLFADDFADQFGCWQGCWPCVRDELAQAIGTVLECAVQAKEADKALLVIGI